MGNSIYSQCVRTDVWRYPAAIGDRPRSVWSAPGRGPDLGKPAIRFFGRVSEHSEWSESRIGSHAGRQRTHGLERYFHRGGAGQYFFLPAFTDFVRLAGHSSVQLCGQPVGMDSAGAPGAPLQSFGGSERGAAGRHPGQRNRRTAFLICAFRPGGPEFGPAGLRRTRGMDAQRFWHASDPGRCRILQPAELEHEPATWMAGLR